MQQWDSIANRSTIYAKEMALVAKLWRDQHPSWVTYIEEVRDQLHRPEVELADAMLGRGEHRDPVGRWARAQPPTARGGGGPRRAKYRVLG